MYRERPSRLDGAAVWTRTEQGEDPDTAPYPVLPDGCMDLLWIDGVLSVAGPDTHAYTPDGLTGARCVGVRLAPGTAPALLGVPAYELRDRRVPLDDLWPGARVRGLTRRMAAAADPEAELEAVALGRAVEAPPDPLMRAVALALGAGRGVAATAEAAGLGARQLRRRSLAAFGYGPKTLARVLRLQRALALVRSGTPYAEAATAAGCSDQAHLAREMRDLTGLTVGAYAALADRETSEGLTGTRADVMIP